MSAWWGEQRWEVACHKNSSGKNFCSVFPPACDPMLLKAQLRSEQSSAEWRQSSSLSLHFIESGRLEACVSSRNDSQKRKVKHVGLTSALRTSHNVRNFIRSRNRSSFLWLRRRQLGSKISSLPMCYTSAVLEWEGEVSVQRKRPLFYITEAKQTEHISFYIAQKFIV